MKNIIATIIIALATSFSSYSFANDAVKETKKVCIDVKDKQGNVVKDSKTGKPKQNCKNMKVHKKLEGTKVPEKK